MKYDRDFLVNVHDDIKNNLDEIGLVPHTSKQHLVSRFTYGCDFHTLRYWRSADTAWMTDHFYDQTNIEIVGMNDKLYIGIWFGKNNKNYLKLKKHAQAVIDKKAEYPDYKWMNERMDENETPSDDELIKWLCEQEHETVFRKELPKFDADTVISEIAHLKEYLDLLLS